MECFSTVRSVCTGLTVPMTPSGWSIFVAEIVSTGLAMIKIGLTFGAQELSDNMIQGVNSLKCVFAGGFEDSWYLIASAYYAAKQFGMESLVADNINLAYPYVCSCKYETNEWNSWIQSSGGQSGSAIAEKFSYCSEAAQAAAAANSSS